MHRIDFFFREIEHGLDERPKLEQAGHDGMHGGRKLAAQRTQSRASSLAARRVDEIRNRLGLSKIQPAFFSAGVSSLSAALSPPTNVATTTTTSHRTIRLFLMTLFPPAFQAPNHVPPYERDSRRNDGYQG